jgi:hypothetical protein
MTVEMLRSFFGWCTLLNWGIMVVALILMTAARGWTTRVHSLIFGVPEEDVRRIVYQMMVFYKVAVFVFNFVPYVALRIIG